ncbi:MAG TPA: dienelactone hydrolase family protein [Thermomicrobiales bacterium]|nr:dienelactone hydrolase family protein [Thermomicrobiales bacterium]
MSARESKLHQGMPVLTSGHALDTARAAMIMIHGRGASAESILQLAEVLDQPGFACIAPQAANATWYPNSFLQPIDTNEPWLTSALRVIADVLRMVSDAGVPPERTMLLGFSQGACLSLEYVARNARRYGGVAGLSGGLIGPDGTPRDYPGALDGTPVFLGCSDIDFHIPAERVRHSAEVLRGLGADVTERLYPGMGHEINHDEIRFVQQMMASVVASAE